MVRYNSLSSFLKGRFGERVRKVMLDAGLTCPNRDGTKGYGGCIYCNWKGSGTGMARKGYSLEEQLKLEIDRLKSKNCNKFIAYFQSYSNTYAPIDVLDRIYSVVLNEPSIVAMAIGTRPDCINEDVVELLKKYRNMGYYIWVELGLQSIHDETLKAINRGHTFRDFLVAYELLKKNGFDVVVHIIFGLPGETREMQIATVKVLSELKVDGVKFHALYILEGTKLAEMYRSSSYTPIGCEEYVDLIVSSLEILPPTTVIHRLVSEKSGPELIAPEWVANKRMVIGKIQRELEIRDTYQGKRYAG